MSGRAEDTFETTSEELCNHCKSILFKSMPCSPTVWHECVCACDCVCMCLCVGGERVRGHISLPSTFRIDFFTDTRLRDKSLVQHGCPHALTHYSSLACAHRSFCRGVYTLSKARSKWSSIIHTDKGLKIYSLL